MPLDKLPHEPFLPDVLRRPININVYTLFSFGRQGGRFHLRKILFRLLRIYITLSSIEYCYTLHSDEFLKE